MRILPVLWIGFLLSLAAWADGTENEASPSPSPSESSSSNMISTDPLNGLSDAIIKRCVETTNRWQDLAGQAQAALENCLFHRFHKACSAAHKISLDEQGPRAACREVMKRKHIPFPDMNCVIVHVPDRCGKE